MGYGRCYIFITQKCWHGRHLSHTRRCVFGAVSQNLVLEAITFKMRPRLPQKQRGLTIFTWEIIRSSVCRRHKQHLLLLLWPELNPRRPAVFKEHGSYRLCAQIVIKEEIIGFERDNNRIMLKQLFRVFIYSNQMM